MVFRFEARTSLLFSFEMEGLLEVEEDRSTTLRRKLGGTVRNQDSFDKTTVSIDHLSTSGKTLRNIDFRFHPARWIASELTLPQ
jgi:hypothetical protein